MSKKQKKGLNKVQLFSRQILTAILLSGVFYYMVNQSQSYTWIFSLMKTNLKIIKEHSNLSYEKKMQIKHGFRYTYCDFINKHTPEDAVILIPSKEAVRNAKELDNNKPTSATLANKSYASYFIYPRIFIYPNEKDKNPLWNKITHVAIIDGQGYEYLNYEVKDKAKYQLLPIRK